MPVPWAEPIVQRWRALYDGSAANGMPAHITVLYPFLASRAIKSSVDTDLGSIAAAYSPFRISLTKVKRFPGVLYLMPEPSEPLVRMTVAVCARWPECPPYLGAHETTIPHLTVATGTEPPGLARQLEDALPIEGEVNELWLMAKERGDRWSVRSRFALQGSI